MSVTTTQQSLLPTRRDKQVASGSYSSSGGGGVSTGGGSCGSSGTTYFAGVNISFSGTTISVVNAPVFSGNVKAPIFSGTTCITAPIICATTCSITPIACASTSVLSPLICGTTCVKTPIINASTCSTTPIACATSCSITPLACATNIILTCNEGTAIFSSGFAGSGWQLTNPSGEATLTVDNIYVRKNMTVYELDINKINSINGGLMISAANGTVYCVSGNKLYFDEDNGNKSFQFQTNDWVRAQVWTGRGICSYIGKVTGTTHSATLGSAYASMSSTCTPWKNMELVQAGNTTCAARQNLIYLTATDQGAPYIDMLAGVTGCTFSGKQKLRIGSLSGISDASFGGSLSGYGLYANNVYLKGQIVIAGGSSGYANMTDKPTTLAGIDSASATKLGGIAAGAQVNTINSGDGLGALDSAANSKLSGIAAGATVGAAWGTNLTNIPAPLGGVGACGLYMNGCNMGYWDGSAWKSYIDSTGAAKFVNVVEFGTCAVGGANVAMSGVDIWENTYAGNSSQIRINMASYNFGIGYFRDTRIGNGKATEMITVCGANYTTYICGTLKGDTAFCAPDFILPSDKNLKTNIQSLSIAPINIEYKQFELCNEIGKKRYGVIAQDLEQYPELVHKGTDGMLGVSYNDLFVREIAALKCCVKQLSLDLNYMRNYNC